MPSSRFDPSPICLLCLALTATVSTGCALVPGESRVALDRQLQNPHHYYHSPKQPDLDGSRVAGVPKANPKWWVENSDDPLPWWWKPEKPLEVRKRTWFLRNPMHNFTSYVIGVSDRHNHRYGINAHSVWNDKGALNLAVTQAGPVIYLPMVSYRGKFLEGYLGWRHSGSFGAALRRAQHDSDGTGPRGRSPKARAREFLARQKKELGRKGAGGQGSKGAGEPAADESPNEPDGTRRPLPETRLPWRDPASTSRRDLFRLPRA